MLKSSASGVLLCGPAGMGKSRLAESLRAAIATPSVVVTCSPHDADVPLAALSHMLSDGLGLLPDSRESVEARLRGHLDELSHGRTPLVVVDGVQWIDEASAGVLATLARAGDIQLLCTARSTRAMPWPLRRLLHEDLLRRVDLAGLGVEEVMHLLETLLDGPVDHDLAVEIVELTGATSSSCARPSVPRCPRGASRSSGVSGPLRSAQGDPGQGGGVRPGRHPC